VVFPTRKIVPVFIVCLVALGGVFALLEYKNQTKTINNDGVISVADQKLIDSIANKDTDGDGLKDWEEALWKTDPNNPDTDGDGTKDGAEIAAGRSPLIKGPNDQLTLNSASTTPSTTRELTASDQFSRDLFTRYVAIKQTGNGDPANYDNYADLVQSYIAQESSTMSPKTYSASDFKVIANETPTDVRNYGNAIGALFVDYSAPKFENELVVLQRAVDNNNPLELDKLNANIIAYQKGRATLLKMAVPSIFLPDHIALTNVISTIILGIESMKSTFSNPIKAAAGLQNYPDATDNFYPLLKSIRDGLVESGVSFTQAESGFQFINIIE